MSEQLTPRQIVHELDRYIVGQNEAKKAVAIALRKHLLKFARERGIRSGSIFVTRGGNPLDRSNIWNQMKRLCVAARVDSRKVFPHN